MKKEWFFDRFCGQQVAALLEDGKLTEFSAETEGKGDLVGNIYKGKVMNVVSGMEAAFISCGLERNCYLSMDQADEKYAKYDGVLGGGAEEKLKEGDEVIVQVVKPPRGMKGAKVSTHLSFVGKNLIYLPNTDFIGISRKITDEKKREELLSSARSLCINEGEGYIARTVSADASKKTLKKEADYLKKLYASAMNKAKKAKVGELIYRDDELPIRIMRDSIDGEVEAIHIGNKELYEKFLELCARGGFPERKIEFYDGDRSMLREYGIAPLVFDLARPVVGLKSGGSIVIDRAEAMTVIDVNTGSFVGGKSLEETVFKVNMEAAEEIARQVRLRNVGGIVVVDFIDMTDEEHKTAVNDALTRALLEDKAKCRVLPMSDLCLTQFTRKRVGADVLSYLVKPCEDCGARGYVQSDLLVASKIRADIIDAFADGYSSVVVELNAKLMKRILDDELFSEDVRGKWKNARVYLVPHKTYDGAQYEVRGDNSGVLTLPDKAQILY